jgi:hypothetical protein
MFLSYRPSSGVQAEANDNIKIILDIENDIYLKGP